MHNKKDKDIDTTRAERASRFVCGFLILVLGYVNAFLFNLGPDTWIWWAIVLCSFFSVYYGFINGRREKEFMDRNNVKADDEVFNLTFYLDTSVMGIIMVIINTFAYPVCAIAYGIPIVSLEFWVNFLILAIIEGFAKAGGSFVPESETNGKADTVQYSNNEPDYGPVEQACGSYIAAEAKKMVNAHRRLTKTGRKTSYPVIIRKYKEQGTSLLYFPDFKNYIVWTKSLGEKELEEDAEFMLRCLIDSVKLSEKQLPFSSDLNDLTILEGEYKKIVIAHKEGSAIE